MEHRIAPKKSKDKAILDTHSKKSRLQCIRGTKSKEYRNQLSIAIDFSQPWRQELKQRTVGTQLIKIGHVDWVSVANGSSPLRRLFGVALSKRQAAAMGPATRNTLGRNNASTMNI